MVTEAQSHSTNTTKTTDVGHPSPTAHLSYDAGMSRPFGSSPPPTQFAESAKLEQAIKANLRGLGYGG